MAEPGDCISDLLDCPICLQPLASPVFQCTNGHVSCESCCTRMSNTCASCRLPIGDIQCRAVENILESLRFPCTNQQHGCRESLTYIKKLDHEKTCKYAPCYCPHFNCYYVGLPKCVYTHFASQHSWDSWKFVPDFNFSIVFGQLQKHAFLQGRLLDGSDIVFVLNRSIENLGSIVNVICIAPTSSKKQFSYVLTASDDVSKSKIVLESVAENVPQWTQQAPATNYVIVPNYCLTATGLLCLEITICR